ncbi:radical SAM/SPASM domain-containing protein [Candidatus Methylopumilus universalis]|uniref:Radical SAM/SPASM domain-containing protein n=1 Tax=Candidatus Methylopumilus universalis TaxID=2588536 RepID=A0ABX5VUG3_9PROT|nr:radical SAM/SPASM domain-containing protein [Candidatus Methylopumilus universalis]QDC51249.1 radical SAM/SPASM domain-containing protein [Candidatus Methylopumilus universalis]QDC61387.1 radical SAM/SPASM domain-containing protein [Candidatus Methylopumilus universalis]
MLETASTFLEYRRKQEIELRDSNLSTGALPGLLTIEINITELCNRVCSFCPRSNPEVYPNSNLMISPVIVKKIASEIKRLRYVRKISFSGFGEPTLNRDFPSIVRAFRDVSEDLVLETNTNGDKLTSDYLDLLWEAGLNNLYWNLYDGPEQKDQILEIVKKSKFPINRVRLRPHWLGCDLEKEVGLILNNRSGAVAVNGSKVGISKKCNYPFYKMLIDWNGNVLCCSNDWLRKNIIGNVISTPLDEIWISNKWHDFRLNIVNGDRALNEPCSTCDVDGELFGSESVDEYFKFRSKGEV